MNIWVPKCKILEPRREIVLASRLSGFFKMEAVRPDGRRRLLADWFPNLITNAGLNAIGSDGSIAWLGSCRVGTGGSTPSFSDTAMDAQVAGTGTVTSYNRSAQSSPPYYGLTTTTFRFTTGTAAGNLAEVGIASQNSAGGTQFSRALILDGDGNPTTITVLSDEVLDVTYRLQTIPPGSDTTDTITIGGIDYDLVMRACHVTSVSDWSFNGYDFGGIQGPVAFDGSIGAVTASTPSGSLSGATSVTPSSYSADSFHRESTVSFGLGQANFGGGITAFCWNLGTSGYFGKMQCSVNNHDSPAKGIPKTSSDVLSLVMRHTWARGTPI